MEAHRYEEAAAAYRRRLHAEPDHWPSIAGLARTLLAAGNYRDALPLLLRVDEYERRRLPGHPGRKHELSCLYWCLGDRIQAKQIMRELVQGILDRTIEFADMAGGVQQGAILHYMGISTDDSESTEFALSYLGKLSKKARIKHWPGPVALHLLGRLDTESLLAAASGTATMEQALIAVESNILSRRQLCVAAFHHGIRLRALGNDEECLVWLRACAGLKNPLVEPEWYLAQHEIHPWNAAEPFALL